MAAAFRKLAGWQTLFAVLTGLGTALFAFGTFMVAVGALATGNGAMLLIALPYAGITALYCYFSALLWRARATAHAAAVANPYARNFELALEAQARFWTAIGVATLVFFALYGVAIVAVIGLALTGPRP